MQKSLAARELEFEARRIGDAAQRNWLQTTATIGLIAKGVSFAIVGGLAVALAAGEGGKATSREGALATIADESGGMILLILLALGFIAYALWRLAQAFFEERDDEDGSFKKWGKIAGYVARAAIYIGLTYATVEILVGAGGSHSQNQKARQAAGEVLSWPAGTWLVGIAGAAIAGAGLYNGYRGVSRKFRDRWKTGEMSQAVLKWGTRIGVAGLLARMVVFGLIGWFLIKAAAEYDPTEAIGLDGALRTLSHQSYGPFLLGVTAAGLIAYALFCFVEARYRDVKPSA
jgi:Domain of Unknown Function (DUF1206)